MTATNHGLSGAIIGLSITQPALALPLAFVSHFVLDMVPHFGGIHFYKSNKRRKLFHAYLLTDASLLAIVMISLFLAGAGWLAFACLFLAGSPDFLHAYHYLFNKKFHKHGPEFRKSRFDRFHKRIQWSETPKGIFLEVPLAIIFSIIISSLL